MTIDDDSSIYAGGLPYNITEETLRKAFGAILAVKTVHDKNIIIGSANINQRSMDGARDSEIARGAYQSYHLSHNQPSRGQIHGFRMSSWYEHLGLLENSFSYPQSMECQQKVNQLAQSNWELYASEALESDLPGHLLSYLIGVSSEGSISELPRLENFLNTKARVLGSRADFYPPILTS